MRRVSYGQGGVPLLVGYRLSPDVTTFVKGNPVRRTTISVTGAKPTARLIHIYECAKDPDISWLQTGYAVLLRGTQYGASNLRRRSPPFLIQKATGQLDINGDGIFPTSW